MKENASHTLAEEQYFHGAPVSEGIAIGQLFFIGSFDDEDDESKFALRQEEIENEIRRYRKALSSSRKDLEKLHDTLSNEGSDEASHIIDAHIQMLSDPLMTTHMEEMIRNMKQNTEAVFRSVMIDYQQKLSGVKETLFQQRAIDVIDLSHRVLNHLRPKANHRLSDIPPNAVVFAKEIVPSETATAGASRVSAFVTQVGGGSSHAALIARSKGIPFVASIDIQLLKNAQSRRVIVNGLTGDVIINPTEETLEKHRAIQALLEKESKELEEEIELPAQTVDGKEISLHVNVSSVVELEKMTQYCALGVGLFRTEFLLADDSALFLSEERQYEVYRQVLSKAGQLPVVMRVFDVGGDKFPHLVLEREKNLSSLSSVRGIRFLLRHKDIFKMQLRALLRASQNGSMRLLLPLVSDIREVRETKALIQEVQKELLAENIETTSPPLGCMIEVPAAVMISEELAKECDFVSLGTNDLIQSVLGIERSQLEVSESNVPAHPSIIRMIKRVIDAAHFYHRSVTLCGEIASNPYFVPLLLGLGIDVFSCCPRYVPIVKRIIRQSEYRKAQVLAEQVLTCQSSDEAMNRLKAHYQDLN